MLAGHFRAGHQRAPAAAVVSPPVRQAIGKDVSLMRQGKKKFLSKPKARLGGGKKKHQRYKRSKRTGETHYDSGAVGQHYQQHVPADFEDPVLVVEPGMPGGFHREEAWRR